MKSEKVMDFIFESEKYSASHPQLKLARLTVGLRGCSLIILTHGR